MECLVSDERAQRIDEQTRRAVAQCTARGVYVENERFAAAGCHDAHGGAPLLKMVEHFSLLGMQLTIADERTHDVRLELRRLRCSAAFPRGTSLGAAGLERLNVLGAFSLRLAKLFV